MIEFVKQASLVAAGTRTFARFLSLAERVADRRPNLLRVLTYHRVDEPDARPALYPGLISATPKEFELQAGYLAANCHVVSMPEVLETCASGTALPSRAVLLTFDDAYRDFAEHAWPILKRYRLPATLFVPTAFPDQPGRIFWWDRLHQAVNNFVGRQDLNTPLGRLPLMTADQRGQAFVRLKKYAQRLPHHETMALVARICDDLGAALPTPAVLGWDVLRQLAREGVTLAAHTCTHPLLNRLSLGEARAEALGSLCDLEREIGRALPVLAYPGGEYNHQLVRVLARAGFVLAFTTVRGINDLRVADRLRLRRINVGRHTNLAVLRAQLLPWSVHLNRWQQLSSR